MPDETDQLRAALRAACQVVERQYNLIAELRIVIGRLADTAHRDTEDLRAGSAMLRVGWGKPMPGDIERIAEGVAGEPAG